MQILITTKRKPFSKKFTRWFINRAGQGCYGGLGCRDCSLFLPAEESGSHCILFHTLSETQLRAFLSSLLDKHRDQIIELHDVLNNYPEMLL